MPRRNDFISARALLAAIWFLSFGLNCVVILLFHQREWIEWDNTKAALSKLSTIYNPYLGSILGVYLATRMPKKKAQETEGASPVIAIAVALIWNGVLSFFFLRLLSGSGEIEKSIEQVEWMGTTFNWLVAGMMGFYFAQTASPKEGADK